MTATRFFDATNFTPFADDDAIWGGVAFVEVVGIASVETFGSLQVLAARTIVATGLASAEALGVPRIPAGLQRIFASGVVSAEAFGSPQEILFQPTGVWKKVQLVAPLTDATSVLFGYSGGPPTTNDWYEYNAVSSDGFAVTVNPDGTYYIDGSNGLDPSDSFQGRWYSTTDRSWSALATVTLISSPFTLGAITIVSQEAFGVAALSAQSGGLIASGVASAEAFGTPTIILAGVLRPSAIAPQEIFGVAEVIVANRIVPAGLSSGEFFSQHTIVSTIRAGVVVSQETFGPITLTNFTNKLAPLGIASETVFGDVNTVVNRVMTAFSLDSAEAFGKVLVFSPGVWTIETSLSEKHWVEETPQ